MTNDTLTTNDLAAFIAREIRKHDNLEYWNTEEWLGNEIKIYDTAIEQGIINQDWLDDRINCHAPECLGFLLEEINNPKTRTYQYFNDRVFAGKRHREIAQLFAEKVETLYGVELGIMKSDFQTDVIMDKLPDEIWFEWFDGFMEEHGVEVYD